MDAKGALRTVYMDERHVVAYSDDHVMSTEKHAYQHLAALLAESRFDQAVVGVELDNYYYSAASHIHLLAGLPQAHIVDATGLINWQRTIKSEQELVYMRRAARIVEKMHNRILELIEPGMRKNDLERRSIILQLREQKSSEEIIPPLSHSCLQELMHQLHT